MPQINSNSNELYESQTGYPLKKETYELIGICMKVHNVLGHGFLEIVYKDAIELELRKCNIQYYREKEYKVEYEGVILPHRFYSDFVVADNIILELKATDEGLASDHLAQMINYLKVSKCKIGLLINFGKKQLEYRRVAL